MRRMFFGILIIIAASANSHASISFRSRCEDLLQERSAALPVAYDLKAFERSLQGVPVLRDLVLDLMNDPSVSRSIKLILKNALEQSAVPVQEMTPEIQSETPTFRAVMKIAKEIHVRLHINQPGTASLVMPDGVVFDAKRLTRIRVVTPQVLMRDPRVQITIQENQFHFKMLEPGGSDLTNLIHELAHVKFESFLMKYLPALSKRFPPDLISRLPDDGSEIGGSYVIDAQLFTYLTERYAHEAQDLAYSEIPKKYQASTNLNFELRASENRAMMTQQIISNYGISDPRIIGMNSRSLKNILLNGYNPARDRSQSRYSYDKELQTQYNNEVGRLLQYLQQFSG